MNVGEIREGYIAKWKTYPTDEVKIRVARPSVLGPSKKLLDSYLLAKNQCKKNKWDANCRQWAYEAIHYRIRYRGEINENPAALKKILEITALVLNGKNVRLICYERNAPCHRFILKRMIEAKVFAATEEIKKHANNTKT